MPRASYRKSVIHAVENLQSTREKRKNGLLNPDAPLTEQQRLFVNHVVDDRMTQTAAARAAGYAQPGTAGMELMNHPKIMQAIAVRRQEYAVASQITKKQVIDGFLESIEMAKQKAEPLVMIAGWREVGKMCGLYEAQKTTLEVTHKGAVLLQKMNTMTDEELLQLAEADPTVLDVEAKVVDTPQDADQS